MVFFVKLLMIQFEQKNSFQWQFSSRRILITDKLFSYIEPGAKLILGGAKLTKTRRPKFKSNIGVVPLRQSEIWARQRSVCRFRASHSVYISRLRRFKEIEMICFITQNFKPLSGFLHRFYSTTYFCAVPKSPRKNGSVFTMSRFETKKAWYVRLWRQ